MNTANMRRSTPVEQRMNCEKLYKLIMYLRNSKQKVQSLLVLRNGYAVADVHFYPFHGEVAYYLNCCTASVISALVGIALGEGLIGDLGDKVLGYLPEYTVDPEDQRKKEITIEHLLQMAAGLVWDDVNNVFGENNYFDRMILSDDPVGFILAQPMREEAGKRYNHCVGAPHLLSAVLQKVTGMSTAAYAEEKLFKPLGINGAVWSSDNNGISIGGSGLSMTAEGLAKIGQLYLQKGKWEGMQIIPESWISLSTKKHIDTPEGPWSFYGGGYQWNINRFGGYSAKGVNGQYLSVVPNLKLVAVIMASLPVDELFWPETLMESFIIPAARFADTGQANRQNQDKLTELINEIKAPPEPKPVPPLPEIAPKISGRKFVFNTPSHIQGISLDFCHKDSCIFKAFYDGGIMEAPAGLDDVYRITGNEAYKGYWQDSNTFIAKMLNLSMNFEMEHRITFQEGGVGYELFSPLWGVCEKLEGGLASE